ncbi:MAG TPA: metallophosphoesterase [Acidimicrobiales bacterium]|nr:metallophosphoesterase [Acidimicrobiales bacterium]
MDERPGPEVGKAATGSGAPAVTAAEGGSSTPAEVAPGVRGDGGPAPPPPPERVTGARAVLGRARSHLPRARTVLLSLAGAAIAVALLGRVPAKVGPFETTVAARPSLSGHTVVHLAPLGTIELDTHDWPLAIDLRVDEIAVADAERIARDPRAIERLGDDAADEVRSALVAVAIRCVIVALAGGIAGALVARLSWRSAAAGAGLAGLFVATLGGGAAATFDAEAVAEPRYSGLLSRAPTAVGDIEAVLDRFGEYRAQLSDLVDNMATLYLAGAELPTFRPDGGMIRVLHVSDIHLNPQAFDMVERLIEQFGVNVVVDTGDLTDWGTDPETRLVDRIGEIDVPYVYVRGNHDSRRTQEAVGEQPNAVVLDGDGEEVAGLRFWGIGDPRYTPDKSEQGGATEQERAEAFAPEVAERLTEDEPPPVDVAMVHDQRMAGDLGGLVPLVLAGHTHEPAESQIERPTAEDEDGDSGSGEEDGDTDATDTATSADGGGDEAGDGDGGDGDEAAGTGGQGDDGEDGEETLLLVEGSTGGAGLRGLQGEEPEPLTATILYFDPESRRLVAYDRISVAWLQDAGATIERRIVDDVREAARDERDENESDAGDG